VFLLLVWGSPSDPGLDAIAQWFSQKTVIFVSNVVEQGILLLRILELHGHCGCQMEPKKLPHHFWEILED
jgi:hypothetical protein